MEEKELNTPVGYKYIEEYLKNKNIEVFPYFRESYIRKSGVTKITETPEKITYYYLKKYQPEDTLFSQLEFALRNEGVNLEIIEKLFQVLPEEEIKNYINKSIKGKYTRIIWFLYEWLTDKKLDLPDIPRVNYISLLDDKLYFTTRPNKLKRYCLNENLLGNRNFCPFVRKTYIIKDYETKNLKDKAEKIIERYDYNTILRASSYLYAKETRSSYEIERERPNKKRAAKFIIALQGVDSMDQLSKKMLLELQNIIVESPFADKDYRKDQNYMGETIGAIERIHYVSPKPEDIEGLMKGLLDCYQRLIDSDVPSVIIATVISFGFVFIHPFSDANGRIHRFLIHYILSKKGFTPPNTIFPVSAAILEDIKGYDSILESFSKKIVPLIDYELNNSLELTVNNETLSYYKYIDFTSCVEYLYRIIDHIIEYDFENEIIFLINYDKSKSEMQEILDMPDRLADLFIKVVIQNKGILSINKRKEHFDMLNDDQIHDLEQIIQKKFDQCNQDKTD
ncbi:MAG: Fic family protein [bacterium]